MKVFQTILTSIAIMSMPSCGDLTPPICTDLEIVDGTEKAVRHQVKPMQRKASVTKSNARIRKRKLRILGLEDTNLNTAGVLFLNSMICSLRNANLMQIVWSSVFLTQPQKNSICLNRWNSFDVESLKVWGTSGVLLLLFNLVFHLSNNGFSVS